MWSLQLTFAAESNFLCRRLLKSVVQPVISISKANKQKQDATGFDNFIDVSSTSRLQLASQASVRTWASKPDHVSQDAKPWRSTGVIEPYCLQCVCCHILETLQWITSIAGSPDVPIDKPLSRLWNERLNTLQVVLSRCQTLHTVKEIKISLTVKGRVDTDTKEPHIMSNDPWNDSLVPTNNRYCNSRLVSHCKCMQQPSTSKISNSPACRAWMELC